MEAKEKTPHPNQIKKALQVQALVEKHYEEGRQDRCKSAIWRSVVRHQFPMSQITFWRLLAIAKKHRATGTAVPKQSGTKYADRLNSI